MSPHPADRLIQALQAVEPGSGAAALVETWRAAKAAPDCPLAGRRRAYRLLDHLPSTWRERVAELVFDSWAATPALARSATGARLLGFASEGITMDAELARDAVDGALTVAVASEGEGPGARVSVHAAEATANGPEIGASLAEFDLDVHGVGSTVVATRHSTVRLVLRDDLGVLMRTEPVEVL